MPTPVPWPRDPWLLLLVVPAVFERLVGLMRSGDIRPLVSRTYPLQDIARAQEDFSSKTLPGKLVLIPPQETET